MTTAMEQAIAALAPFAKQAASLPSHDDHVTVFGVALGDCRAAARALAALRTEQEPVQEELETTFPAPAEIEAMAKRLDEQAIAQHSYSSGTEPVEAYLGSQAAALLRRFIPK